MRRYPVFIVLALLWPVLSRLPWQVVWVVNAGSARDARAYCPPWLQGWVRRHRPLSPLGILASPGLGLSLVVASPLHNDELMSSPEACRAIVDRATRFRAAAIALNGVIPAALNRHELWPAGDHRFARSQAATVFMVVDNVREALARHRDEVGPGPRVAVLGVGHTGAQVANRLAEEGYEVLAFDERPEAGRRLGPDVAFLARRYTGLRRAHVVVVLTGRGDDGAAVLRPHVRPGTIVISDTHPKITRERWRELVDAGAVAHESTLVHPGTRTFPRLPRWRGDCVPGCLGQAFLEARSGGPIESPHRFEALAHALGLRGRLDVPSIPDAVEAPRAVQLPTAAPPSRDRRSRLAA